MPDLRARLTSGPCLLLDGGMGSMLIARGLAQGEAPERMNLAAPEMVTEVHRLYVAAGSECVHTNTFGANPIRLAQFGLAERCGELNGRAVELARAAGPAFVLGDIGPTGEYLPPVGKGHPERWRAAFRVQIEALLASDVDGLHIETMGDLREARVALDAIRAHDADLPVLASLTFDRKKRGFFTLMGDPLQPALKELAAAGATAVGANCSVTSSDMAVLAEEALGGIDTALVFQPNAGQPLLEGGKVHYAQSASDFAEDLRAVAAAGAAALGGCCGSDPEFIAQLAAILHELGP